MKEKIMEILNEKLNNIENANETEKIIAKVLKENFLNNKKLEELNTASQIETEFFKYMREISRDALEKVIQEKIKQEEEEHKKK